MLRCTSGKVIEHEAGLRPIFATNALSARVQKGDPAVHRPDYENWSSDKIIYKD